jgi:DNA-binding NarL/FixJ family response regulator
MNKLRTLIVEDSSLFRQTLKESLQMSFPGIAIDEAANGAEALQRVNASLPDLILMDIRIPGESGLGLTKKIKEIYPDVTVFILTHYDTPECREASRSIHHLTNVIQAIYNSFWAERLHKDSNQREGNR